LRVTGPLKQGFGKRKPILRLRDTVFDNSIPFRKNDLLRITQTPTEMEDRRATVTDALQSTTFRLYSSAAAPVTGAAAPRQPLPRCQGTKCRPGKRLRGVNPLKGVLGLVMIALLVFDDAAALRVLAPMSWSSSGRLACSNEPPALQMGARGGEVGSNDWLRTRAKVVVIDERRAFPSRYKAALVQRAQSFLTSFVQRGGDDGQFYGVRGGGDTDASRLSASYEYVGPDMHSAGPVTVQFYGFALDPFERSSPVLRFFGRTYDNASLTCDLTFDADWRVAKFSVSADCLGAWRQASASPQASCPSPAVETLPPPRSLSSEELLRTEIDVLKQQIAQQKKESEDEIAQLRREFRKLE